MPDETRQAVREWARRWEQLANQDMVAEDFAAGMADIPAEHVSQEQWDALDHDGRAVWIRLRDDLGEGWMVGRVTSPDAGRQVEWSPGAPPEKLPGS